MLDKAPRREGPDEHRLIHARAHAGGLSSSSVYALLRFGGVTATYAAMIWGARVPSRVKFFWWLLVQRHIHTRDVLLRKCILAANEAGCPLCPVTLETADHLMFACPFVGGCWQKVGMCADGASLSNLNSLARAANNVVDSGVEFVML